MTAGYQSGIFLLLLFLSGCAHRPATAPSKTDQTRPYRIEPMRVEMRRDLARARAFFAHPRRSPDAVLRRGDWLPELTINPGTELRLSTQRGPAQGIYLGHDQSGVIFLGNAAGTADHGAMAPWQQIETQQVHGVRLIRETCWPAALLTGVIVGGVSGLLSHSTKLGTAHRSMWGSALGLGIGTIAGFLYEIDPDYDFGDADRIRRIQMGQAPSPLRKSGFNQSSP